MAHEFRHCPFFASTAERNRLDAVLGPHGEESRLDHLGTSSLGELYWNSGSPSLGIVCGAVIQESSSIVRRLIASHLTDPTAEVLIIHTDYFLLKSTPCPLLRREWRPIRILAAPDHNEEVTSTYSADYGTASPITFKETSMTMRHLLALFTPPPTMQGSSAILSTVQLIVSQLRPPFDLQKFIELVEKEKWTEEGENFIAIRQTLLTKLLSPALDDEPKDASRRVTLVDLTDAVLQSTCLDGLIMNMAMHEFLNTTGRKKMIVLNNCQQYLSPTSTLTKTLETLAAQGHDRPASIILSMTEPTTISPTLLHSVDYVVFGSSRSLLWREFLHQHFAKSTIPKTQLRLGRAMIWSHESGIHGVGVSKADPESMKSWDDILAFIDIGQFELTISSNPPPNDSPNGTLVNGDSGDGVMSGEMVGESQSDVQDIDLEDEEGIMPLDRLGTGDAFTALNAAPHTSASLSDSINENADSPAVPPSKPSKTPSTAKRYPRSKFDALTSAISQLCGGEIGILVDFEEVRKQLGKREVIQKLGWTTYTQYVKAACENGVVELIEADPGSKFLTLLPVTPESEGSGITTEVLPKPINEIHHDKPGFWASDPALSTATGRDTLTNGEPKSPPAEGHDQNQPPISLEHYPEQYEDLISAIMRLSGGLTGVKVSLNAVRTEMGEKAIKKGMLTYGWATFGQWVRCACLEKFVEQGATGNDVWIMLSAIGNAAVRHDQSSTESIRSPEVLPVEDPTPLPEEKAQPRDSGDAAASHRPEENRPLGLTKANASDYLFKHRIVVSEILKLTEGTPGIKVRVADVMASLQREYPGALEGVLPSLILDAEKENVLRSEQDDLDVRWTTLQIPDSCRKPPVPSIPTHQPQPPAHTTSPIPPPPSVHPTSVIPPGSPTPTQQPQPSTPTPQPGPPSPSVNHTNATPPDPALQPRTLSVAEYPFKHRAIVSVIIRLTNGTSGTRIKMIDLTESLKTEYRGANPNFLFSLIVDAGNSRVIQRETDNTGVMWVSLRDMTLPENPTSPGVPLIVSNYPYPHRGVASVMLGLAAQVTNRGVPLDLVHRDLCHRRFSVTMQDAMALTTAASNARVIRVQGDDEGGRYALLEAPALSKSSPAPPSTPQPPAGPPNSKQPTTKYTIWDYPVAHRPVVSTVFAITHGKWGVRVDMEAVIKMLVIDPSAKYGDPRVAASVVAQAADANVLRCGTSDGGKWWLCVNAPI